MKKNPEKITVKTTIKMKAEKLWAYYNEPQYITQWKYASDDWHTVAADNDLRVGGEYTYRMEAKDKSDGFDFKAVYDEIIPFESLSYTLVDGRKVIVEFESRGEETEVRETFDADEVMPLEVQRMGWQIILGNFKKFAEEKL